MKSQRSGPNAASPVASGLAAALVLVIAAGATFAQGNQALAGAWTLQQEPGARGGGGRGGGIPGVPVATELMIKVSPSEITVDTNTGSAQSMQTAVYKVDGTETSVPGPLGWTVTARAAWKDSTLVVNTVRSLEGPNGPIGAEVVDVYTATADALTIQRTQGRNKQTLVYKKR
jgi:hypothetical protein